MEIDCITPELLETAFKQWRQAHDPPLELLELDLLLHQNAHSPAERAIQLYDYLLATVTEQLAFCRQAEEIEPSSARPLSRHTLLTDLAQDFRTNNATLEAWSILYYRYLATLQLSVQELATGANVEERQLRRRLELGLRLLVDVLRRAEKEVHDRQLRRYLGRHLPPPEYGRLFGVDTVVRHILSLLSDPAQPQFVSIEGLGGIGKTTLAHAVAEKSAVQGQFQDILWVQASQTRFGDQRGIEPICNPADTTEEILIRLAAQLELADAHSLTIAQLQTQLQWLFAHQPYLIVIDNLETVEDAQTLLTALQALAGQSRFLLTSRHTLRYTPFVQTIHIPALSFEDSAAFIRYEAQRKNQIGSLALPVVEEIYEAIGGLPLAIRLVTNQIGRLPLPTILDGLKHAHQQLSESLYTYIYRRSWQLLSNPARRLLLSMLFTAVEDNDMSGVRPIRTLDEVTMHKAIEEVVDYSLVEIRGSIERPIYELHRITRTFLQTELLLQWRQQERDEPCTCCIQPPPPPILCRNLAH